MIKPRFLFRLDVSPSAGMGHLRRCLTLAYELQEQGAEIFFACRLDSFGIEKYMAPLAEEWEKYDWSLTPEEDAQKVVQSCRKYQAAAVIVDHYRADESYQKTLYGAGIKWLQFDGAARYPFWADWILNISPAASVETYKKLKQRNETRLLLGPRYALLRKEFRRRPLEGKKGRPVRKILLTFGGGDDWGATIFCLAAMQSLSEDIERIVLLSSANPRRSEILQWNQNYANTRIILDAEETASYMAEADIAVTAGGMTVFELASLGIPAIIIQIADNQILISKAWRQYGFGFDMGSLDQLNPEKLQLKIISLMQDAVCRETMSSAGRQMVDGMGAMRVADILLNQSMKEGG